MKRAVGVALIVLVAATPLVAQQHQMQGMQHEQNTMAGQGMMGGMDMMAALGPGPMMLVSAKDALGLTDSQVERLNAIREEAHAQHQTHMTAAMESHHAAMEALAGDAPDLAGHEEHLRAHHEHMLQAHMAMARAHVRANEVLTAGQRATLATAQAVMKALHGGEGHGTQGEGMMHSGGGMRPATSGLY